MQLKQFFEKNKNLHNHQGFGFYSICNLDFWIISILVAYDGKKGCRNRIGKTWYLHISVLHTIKIQAKHRFQVIKKELQIIYSSLQSGTFAITFPAYTRLLKDYLIYKIRMLSFFYSDNLLCFFFPLCCCAVRTVQPEN